MLTGNVARTSRCRCPKVDSPHEPSLETVAYDRIGDSTETRRHRNTTSRELVPARRLFMSIAAGAALNRRFQVAGPHRELSQDRTSAASFRGERCRGSRALQDGRGVVHAFTTTDPLFGWQPSSFFSRRARRAWRPFNRQPRDPWSSRTLTRRRIQLVPRRQWTPSGMTDRGSKGPSTLWTTRC